MATHNNLNLIVTLTQKRVLQLATQCENTHQQHIRNI
jgi:hypothetical protein